MKLLEEAKARAIDAAAHHAENVLLPLLALAIRDFEASDNKRFSVKLEVSGERAEGDESCIVIHATGKTAVKMEEKEETEPETIYNTPTLPGMEPTRAEALRGMAEVMEKHGATLTVTVNEKGGAE